MNLTLSKLDDEWERIDRQPASARSLRRWAYDEPSLRGCSTLGSLLARRKREASCAPAVLAALARLAPGDELAARTLLQALLPGLVRLASTTCADDPLALDELVSLAWERIRTYPPSRTGSVAANIILDARKRYREHRGIEAPVSGPIDVEVIRPMPSAEEVVLGRCAVNDLIAAQRDGIIGRSALALILRTRVDQVPLRVAAEEQHSTVGHANCVRWRAERRLRPVLAMAS